MTPLVVICVLIIAFCLIGIVTKRIITSWILPDGFTDTFGARFRWFVAEFWYDLGGILCFIVGACAGVALWRLLS